MTGGRMLQSNTKPWPDGGNGPLAKARRISVRGGKRTIAASGIEVAFADDLVI
jgi:hypothetical protein